MCRSVLLGYGARGTQTRTRDVLLLSYLNTTRFSGTTTVKQSRWDPVSRDPLVPLVNRPVISKSGELRRIGMYLSEAVVIKEDYFKLLTERYVGSSP